MTQTAGSPIPEKYGRVLQSYVHYSLFGMATPQECTLSAYEYICYSPPCVHDTGVQPYMCSSWCGSGCELCNRRGLNYMLVEPHRCYFSAPLTVLVGYLGVG